MLETWYEKGMYTDNICMFIVMKKKDVTSFVVSYDFIDVSYDFIDASSPLQPH